MKTIRIVIITLLVLSFTSCKKEVKKEPAKFSVEQKTITINWTAYKTTDKVPVKGKFEEIKVSNVKEAETSIDALNNAKFEIPISSLNSNNEERDSKLKNLFFGVLEATVSLTGTLHLNTDGSGNINLKMNGIEETIPITYVASGQIVNISGTMNLDKWSVAKAIISLNEACNEKHKGEDGISKTWTEVEIDAIIYLKKE